MRVTDFVFELWASKAKIKGVFTGFLVAMVTDYVKMMDKTYFAIISLSIDAIVVENVGCHLNPIENLRRIIDED